MIAMVAHWTMALLVAIGSALPPIKVYLHDPDFPFNPVRFVALATAVFGGFAGLHFCWGRMFRRPLDRGLSTVHFWGTVVFFNVSAIPLLIMGAGVQYPSPLDPRVLSIGAGPLARWALVGLCGLAFYQLPFFWGVMLSLLNASPRSAPAPGAEASASELHTR
jgi:heme/copper-type cytochrome/quinol oxidase subunit 1